MKYLFLFLVPWTSFAKDLNAEIKSLLSKGNKEYSFSLRDHLGNEIININGEKPLAPASIAKTISTGCSLKTLGPQFQFETLFGYQGRLEGDTLKGDLVIQGGGDPSLVIEDLKEIIEKIRFVHGIKKIEGNLVLDVSYLGTKSLKMAEGFDGDNGRSFAAELTAVAMNQNSFSFWVTPDHRGNKNTRAVTLPAQVVDVNVTNKSKVGGSNTINVNYNPDTKMATITGAINEDAEPKGIYRSVADPYQYYTDLIQRLWLESGGEWPKNKTKIETQKQKYTLLWKHSSRPLAKILMDINKLSLNMGAEMTLLAAAEQKKGRPSNYEKVLTLLKECLTDFQINPADLKLTNASGLSRETEIKTSALTQFLWHMHKTAYSPEYLSSFSLLGIDGTTKSRLKQYAGRGRMKTGSIKGVRSIAGYLYNEKGQSMSFAMILNGVDSNSSQVKALEDQVLEKILSGF